MIGVLAAAAQGGDEKALQVGAQVAGAATQYNYLFHAEIEQMLAEQDGCANQTCKSQIAERYAELDSSRNAELAALCDSSPGTCDAILTRLMAEEPAILEMAKNLAGEGKIGAALVIGASIAPSNSSAMLTIASELGANSEFQAALGDLVLAGATGGLGRAGGTKRPSAVGGDGSGPKATGPVPNLTERGTLVNLRPNDVAIAQRPVRALVQDESGRYWLQTSTGKRITPSGSYDFVTMPDGSIRVARPNVNQDFSTHLGLSGGGEVKYAGSIRFGNNDGPSRGTITQWTNNSGHYQPPVTLSGNAGLPQGLFNLR